ncbi:MAG TPA: sigma-70 family RNA polymerase sigma factor [Burkholderiales bacterium]|nr:sigma-70 family RNA polymerase sigma factor [Burkholderiales bacterium]
MPVRLTEQPDRVAGSAPSAAEEEREWIRRAQAGERAAYSKLVGRYQGRLYRFILRMVGTREEALELSQDVFIKAWQALPQWTPGAAFHTWLFRIGSNAAMDALRRRKVVEFTALDPQYDAVSGNPGPEAQLESKQRLRALEAALAWLPPEQREALLLREVEGLSYAELSAVLGVNEGTVKSRLARARTALAARFENADA